MPKSLICDLPYPSTSDICPDALSLKIISPAYASHDSELNTILQYVYHAYFFDRKGYDVYNETLMSIAIAEMMHLELLGKTILALGAAPIYSRCPANTFDFYSTKYVAYSCTLKNMLEDDILGEKRAIGGYEKMLKQLKNEKVSEIVSRIILDEKLHLETLQALYKEFKC